MSRGTFAATAQPVQYRRLALMTLLLLIAFAGLGYRLVDLHVLRHDQLSRTAAGTRQRTVIQASHRGDILDARGNVLATTVFVKTVFADPSLIGTNQAAVARALAPLLRMPEVELAKKLERRTWIDRNGNESEDKYVVLKRKVLPADWERIRIGMRNLSFGRDERGLSRAERAFYRNLRRHAVSVEPVDDQIRVYPNGSLASQVLGFVGSRNNLIEGREVRELAGRYGVEGQFDSYLNGTLGWRQTEVDLFRRELVLFRDGDVAPRPGLNVVLTIDAGLQDIVESELARGLEQHQPRSISCVIVRPRTGEILAMASRPTFDPNQSAGLGSIEHMRNRVIADSYEPGSTFKTIVVSAAINEGAVSLSDIFHCEEGSFHFGGHTLHDAGHRFGKLTVEDILAKSSNIGAAKVGMKLGAEQLHRYILDFGFNQATGIQLPGEAGGSVHPLKSWYKISIAQIPMGQGLTATPLQMAMAVSAIANEGTLMRPLIVNRIEDENNQAMLKYHPQPVRQVINPTSARLVVQAMKKVVLPGGTAPKAGLEHYRVAGKTGTGQKAPYGSGKYLASFIGFFPADDPQVCISVFLDEPSSGGYYGGATAGPIFREIAQRAAAYLAIPADVAMTIEPLSHTSTRIVQSAGGSPLTIVKSERSF